MAIKENNFYKYSLPICTPFIDLIFAFVLIKIIGTVVDFVQGSN